METWREWFEKQANFSTMEVQRIPLIEVDGWGMQNDDDHYGRPDGKYFRLVGTQVSTRRNEREVSSWGQPMLEEVGGRGAVVLIIEEDREDRYLLQTRIEPGNDTSGRMLLGTTLQTSRSNLEQAHGGKRPPRAELVDDLNEDDWVSIVSDGGRFIGKSVDHAIVFATAEEVGELLPTERWFTESEVVEVVRAGLASEYLVKALGVLTFGS